MELSQFLQIRKPEIGNIKQSEVKSHPGQFFQFKEYFLNEAWNARIRHHRWAFSLYCASCRAPCWTSETGTQGSINRQLRPHAQSSSLSSAELSPLSTLPSNSISLCCWHHCHHNGISFLNFHSWFFTFFFFFLLHPWHVEVLKPGIKTTPQQQQAKLLQWQLQTLQRLSHKGTLALCSW